MNYVSIGEVRADLLRLDDIALQELLHCALVSNRQGCKELIKHRIVRFWIEKSFLTQVIHKVTTSNHKLDDRFTTKLLKWLQPVLFDDIGLVESPRH